MSKSTESENSASRGLGDDTTPGVVDETGLESENRMRNLVVGTLFGAVLLYLATRNVSLDEVLAAISAADATDFILGIFVYFLYLVSKTLRWSVLLMTRSGNRPFSVLLHAVILGTAANAIIPHSGEVVRSFGVRKAVGISATSILGSIVAERFYDFLAVVFLTAATFALFPETPSILAKALGLLVLIGTGLLVALLLVAFKTQFVHRVLDFLAHVLPKRLVKSFRWQIDEVAVGVRPALTPRVAVLSALLSLLQWLLVGACVLISIKAMGVDESVWIAFIILPLTVIGLTFPTAPAYLGTVQVCFLVSLAPFGVSENTAIAASFVYIGMTILPLYVAAAILSPFSRTRLFGKHRESSKPDNDTGSELPGSGAVGPD